MTGYLRHEAHGAADPTVVQFYPILVPVATRLGTLNPPTSWRRSRRIQITRFNLKGGLSRSPKRGCLMSWLVNRLVNLRLFQGEP